MAAGGRVSRVFLVSVLLLGGLALTAGKAQAEFHLMEIKEVFAGTSTQSNADFVEFRMKADGQNLVNNHVLHLFEASGNRHDCTITSNVPNALTDNRILFATVEAQASVPAPADFTIPALLNGAGGAVCFEGIDCVSWGSFAGSTASLSPSAPPFPGGIPADQSINRTAVTDTNNSAADFTAGSPSPQRNGGSNLGSMTCTAAGGGGGGGGGGGAGGASLVGLKARVSGARAVISGRIQPPAPGERVAITFYANGSPLKKVAKKSATLNSESRFKKAFRVPGGATRCKARVQFRGATLGQKTFLC